MNVDYLAEQIGVSVIARAPAAYVREVTVTGDRGRSTGGHPRRLRTVVDTALARYPEVWAAGGVPHAVIPTNYQELLAVTGGTAASVAGAG